MTCLRLCRLAPYSRVSQGDIAPVGMAKLQDLATNDVITRQLAIAISGRCH